MLAGLLGVAAAACAPCATGADWGPEQLMQVLGAVKSSQATFVERKHVAILSTPLESSGRLVYQAPDRLEKHTVSPVRESLVLERNALTYSNPERKQRGTLRLQDQPVVWAFVESIRSTLAGDLATLSRFYEVKLGGGERQWRLTLKPSDPQVQEVISEIRIDGSRDVITRIETLETGGDRSVMTITRDSP